MGLWEYKAIPIPQNAHSHELSGLPQIVVQEDQLAGHVASVSLPRRLGLLPRLAAGNAVRRGELAADSAADARASLRRIGLQVIELRPLGRKHIGNGVGIKTRHDRTEQSISLQHQASDDGSTAIFTHSFERAGSGGQSAFMQAGLRGVQQHSTTKRFASLLSSMTAVVHRHLRKRRSTARADLFESIATMMESGLPLVEVFDVLTLEDTKDKGQSKAATLSSEHQLRRFNQLLKFRLPRIGSNGVKGKRLMLLEIREGLRSGLSLAQTMQLHPSWFDPIDWAMVESGQVAGMLSTVLHAMAEREERADEIGNKFIAALTYPSIVFMIAIAVAIFLSIKTLPQLAQLLINAHIQVPPLTVQVIRIGQFLAHWGVLVVAGMGLIALTASLTFRWLVYHNGRFAAFATRLIPQTLRARAISTFATNLADLVRTGVPVVEALKILVPTLPVVLARVVDKAAIEIEQGKELSDALHHRDWFTPEFQRLIQSAQASGRLDEVLDRLAKRYHKRATRFVDRLASILEPAAIITLAVIVGTVVFSAILPLTRIQELIK